MVLEPKKNINFVKGWWENMDVKFLYCYKNMNDIEHLIICNNLQSNYWFFPQMVTVDLPYYCKMSKHNEKQKMFKFYRISIKIPAMM